MLVPSLWNDGSGACTTLAFALAGGARSARVSCGPVGSPDGTGGRGDDAAGAPATVAPRVGKGGRAAASFGAPTRGLHADADAGAGAGAGWPGLEIGAARRPRGVGGPTVTAASLPGSGAGPTFVASAIPDAGSWR